MSTPWPVIDGYDLVAWTEVDARNDKGERASATLTFYRCTTCSAIVTAHAFVGQPGRDDSALQAHREWHAEVVR